MTHYLYCRNDNTGEIFYGKVEHEYLAFDQKNADDATAMTEQRANLLLSRLKPHPGYTYGSLLIEQSL